MGKKKPPRPPSAKTGHAPAKPVQFEDHPYPYDEKMKGKEYGKILLKLQIELVKMQNWVRARGERILLVFEGRDGAGKGGTIKVVTEHLNPRGARVVALLKPNDTERGQWYFQRYISQLPTAGEIVLFDRSWYNRAGVEPVFGFCTRSQYVEFVRQVPDLERSLVGSGIRLFKIWLAVGRDEQKRRLEERRKDPLKGWKLSPIDDEALKKWDAFTQARDTMFYHTHHSEAPWTVVRNDEKRRGRINCLRHILSQIPYDQKDEAVVGRPDPLIVSPPLTFLPNDGEMMFPGR